MRSIYKHIAFIFFVSVFSLHLHAQNIAINSSGNPGNAAAILDLSDASNSNLGLAMPNVSITDANSASPIVAPPTGLMVFNTNAGILNGFGVGFYYWTGSAWVYISNTGNTTSWQIAGNNNIVDGTNFLGTTTDVPLTLQVNSQRAGRIEDGTGINSNFNTYLGWNAGFFNGVGSNNTANGYEALYFNIASDNSAYGFEALYSNRVPDNDAFGYQALYNNVGGTPNDAFGYQALYNNTTGMQNIAVGYQALYNNTTGMQNIGIGYEALYNNFAGNNNVAIGQGTMNNNSFGDNNTVVGSAALFINSNGNDNTAFGSGALQLNSGSNNTGIGFNALNATGSGSPNTAVGYQSMLNNNSGANNVAVGDNALATNTTGTFNTALGSGADVHFNGLTNATAIGSGAIAFTSNSVNVGNISVTQLIFNGDLEPGASGPGTAGQILISQGALVSPVWGALPAGSVTANNGLNISAGNNVQLGGSLINLSTTIGMANNTLTFDQGTFNINTLTGGTTNIGTTGNGATSINTGGSGALNIGNGTSTTITENGNYTLNGNNGAATTNIGTGTTTGAIVIGNNTTTALNETSGTVSINVATGTTTATNIGTGSTTGTTTIGGGTGNPAVAINNGGTGTTTINSGTSTGTVVIGNNTGYTGINQGTPASTLDVNGSVALGITAISGATTLTNAYSTVIATSPPYTITLPTASTVPSRIYTVIYSAAPNSGTITIQPASGNIFDYNSGLASFPLNAGSVQLQSNGTNWYVISPQPQSKIDFGFQLGYPGGQNLGCTAGKFYYMDGPSGIGDGANSASPNSPYALTGSPATSVTLTEGATWSSTTAALPPNASNTFTINQLAAQSSNYIANTSGTFSKLTAWVYTTNGTSDAVSIIVVKYTPTNGAATTATVGSLAVIGQTGGAVLSTVTSPGVVKEIFQVTATPTATPTYNAGDIIIVFFTTGTTANFYVNGQCELLSSTQ